MRTLIGIIIGIAAAALAAMAYALITAAHWLG